MKFWKKTLAMLMACGFVFSAAACMPNENSSESSSGGGSNNPPTEEEILEEKKTYLGEIGDALASAKAFSVAFEGEVKEDAPSLFVDVTVQGNATMSEKTITVDEKAMVIYDLVLSVDVAGTLKVEQDGTEGFSAAEIQQLDMSVNLSVKNGYIYMGQKGEGDEVVWAKYPVPYYELNQQEMPPVEADSAYQGAIEEIAGLMVEAVASNELVTDIVETLTTAVAKSASIKDGMFVIKMDAAPVITEFFTLLKNDPTLQQVADFALAKVDSELNCNAILTKAASYQDKTILEVYDAIDAWLTEEYDTTIQGIVEKVTKDENIIEVFEKINAQVTQGDKFPIDEFKNFNVKETLTAMLEAYNMKEVTVNDLITMMMSTPGGSVSPLEETEQATAMDQLIAMAQTYLGAKLSDMVGEYWTMVEDALACVEVNELSVSFGATKEGEAIDEIEITIAVDMVGFQNEYGEDDVMTFVEAPASAEIVFTLSDISSTAKTVQFPAGLENAQVLPLE